MLINLYYVTGGTSPYRGAVVSRLCYSTYYTPGSELQWQALPNLNTNRCGHTLTTMFDGSVLALGGYSGNVSYLKSGERLDLAGGSWSPLPDMSVERSGAGKQMSAKCSKF